MVDIAKSTKYDTLLQIWKPTIILSRLKLLIKIVQSQSIYTCIPIITLKYFLPSLIDFEISKNQKKSTCSLFSSSYVKFLDYLTIYCVIYVNENVFAICCNNNIWGILILKIFLLTLNHKKIFKSDILLFIWQ